MPKVYIPLHGVRNTPRPNGFAIRNLNIKVIEVVRLGGGVVRKSGAESSWTPTTKKEKEKNMQHKETTL